MQKKNRTEGSTDNGRQPGLNLLRRRPAGRLRRFARTAIAVSIIAGIAFVLGFFAFAERIGTLQTPGALAAADGIVVLTGGQSRLEAAVSLLASAKGKRLLISGVHPTIGKSDVLRATGGNPDLFKCCVDIGHEALQTVGNAAETTKWVRDNDYSSIILVTNNYHMPRSLLEMERVMKGVRITPYPVVNSDLTGGSWMTRPDTVRVLLGEYVRYVGSMGRSVLPVPVSLASMNGK
jgi:uncharacterized SAM-binding protein YcdF (DUF218 family)